MGGIIVALPKEEDAKNICDILRRRGLEVSAVCTTGSSVLSSLNRFEHGVLICTKRFSDMHYTEINNYLPKYFEMILLATPTIIANCPVEIKTIALPFRPIELCNTVEMMLANQRRKIKKNKSLPKKRSESDQNYINNAKMLLMTAHNMTEQEAFRYIQKNSMDSGTDMAEMAQMIITMQI